MSIFGTKLDGSFLDSQWPHLEQLAGLNEQLLSGIGLSREEYGRLSGELRTIASELGHRDCAKLEEVLQLLAAAADSMGRGEAVPSGPAGGILKQGLGLIENLFISLDLGETLSQIEDAVEGILTRARKVVADASATLPAQPPPGATALEPAEEAPDETMPGLPRLKALVEEKSPVPKTRPQSAIRNLQSEESWGPWECPFPDMKDEFFEEVSERISELEEGLVGLGSNADVQDVIASLFRAAHTLKGQCGYFALTPIEQVAHSIESVFSDLRDGKTAASPAIAQTLLEVVDFLSGMAREVKDSGVITASVEDAREKLSRLVAREPGGARERAAAGPAGHSPTRGDSGASKQAERRRAASPEPPRTETAVQEGKPGQRATAETMQAAKTAGSVAGSEVRSRAAATTASSHGKSKEYLRVDFDKLDRAMHLVGDLFASQATLGSVVDEVDRIDGQLTRARASLRDLGQDADDSIGKVKEDISSASIAIDDLGDTLTGSTLKIDSLAKDFRDSLLGMRLVPVDGIFRRLKRVVFDAVRRENSHHGAGYKEVELKLEGGDTEVDKLIADALESPLMHLVRNSVGHGIEPAAEREKRQKPRVGTVLVRAAARGSRFIVQVTDDGAGIDPDRIAQAAVAKGAATEEEVAGMTREEKIQLVFRSGFSTIETADSLSGRGVGLDEVASKIRNLNGFADIRTEPGIGTTFSLSLPLTLAIVPVILVREEREKAGVPLSSVERVITCSEEAVKLSGDIEVIPYLRGSTIQLLRLNRVLGMPEREQARKSSPVLVISAGARRIGLMVDAIEGKHNVIIRALGTLLKNVPLVLGTAVVESKCVLLLDPTELVMKTSRSREATRAKAETTAPAAKEKRPEAGFAKTVLVVDDDKFTRNALVQVLEDSGLKVVAADDGASALELARLKNIHFILTDLVMPGMDGYELTSRLRRMEKYKTVPIVMLTVHADECDRQRAFDAGVDKYLVKPVTEETLISVVGEFLK